MQEIARLLSLLPSSTELSDLFGFLKHQCAQGQASAVKFAMSSCVRAERPLGASQSQSCKSSSGMQVAWSVQKDGSGGSLSEAACGRQHKGLSPSRGKSEAGLSIYTAKRGCGNTTALLGIHYLFLMFSGFQSYKLCKKYPPKCFNLEESFRTHLFFVGTWIFVVVFSFPSLFLPDFIYLKNSLIRFFISLSFFFKFCFFHCSPFIYFIFYYDH